MIEGERLPESKSLDDVVKNIEELGFKIIILEDNEEVVRFAINKTTPDNNQVGISELEARYIYDQLIAEHSSLNGENFALLTHQSGSMNFQLKKRL